MATIEPFVSRRGRPQKFGRPSRAVTLTLPEDIIAALARIDDDLSRAVVRVMQPTLSNLASKPPVELSKFGRGAVIIIKPVPALSRIPGVKLAPLPDGRTLITLRESMTVYEFELRLRDALEAATHLKPKERSIMSSVAEILKGARKTNKITLQQRGIIVLQSFRHRRVANGADVRDGAGPGS
jgi:hypothetical protein